MMFGKGLPRAWEKALRAKRDKRDVEAEKRRIRVRDHHECRWAITDLTQVASQVQSVARTADWPQFAELRLWSLWDMLEFYGQFVVQLGFLPQVWPPLNAGLEPDRESIGAAFGAIKHLRDEAKRLKLPSVSSQCDSIEAYVKERLKSDPNSMRELGRMMVDLYTRATDELKGRFILMLSLDEAEAYTHPLEGWELPIQAFHSSQYDIEEAQRCYSLGRSTACVFHLMRALESPLHTIARELEIEKHSPTWDAYLTKMTSQIPLKFPDKTKEHSEKREYFSGLEGQLRAIKTAWRNPTMHGIGKMYTPAMAHELLILVRGFMSHAGIEMCER